jgi:predicted P-loop ATPase
MIKATLIGAVRRVFEPGCKHDTACVLTGDQGARKSSFWAVLGGAFYSASLGDISDKDDLLKLHRSWIMEWAELDHITGRKHAGQVKSFLSQGTDMFRVPYGKAVEEFPRRGIIVGSTNRATGFLQDETGNRRFWVIPTTCTESNPIDTATLAAERDAILSAAVHAYRAGKLNYLPPDLAQQVSQENENYQLEHPWASPIRLWLSKPKTQLEPITTERALKEAVERPTERQTRADQMAVADILRTEGLAKRRIRHEGTLLWAWSWSQP